MNWFLSELKSFFYIFLTGYVEVPRDEDSEDDSDDEENKAGDGESTEGIIAKAKEEAKTVDEEEAKVIFLVVSLSSYTNVRKNGLVFFQWLFDLNFRREDRITTRWLIPSRSK